jgi:hypothetical protein
MRKSAQVTVALACAMLSGAMPASAAFEAKEAKENSVTFEAKESGVGFVIEEKKEVKGEVTCETTHGEGALDEKGGVNAGVAAHDETASGLEVESEQAVFKIKFEKCSGSIAGVKGTDTVNSEKCEYELWDEPDTEGKAEASLSLHGTVKEKPCTLTIESSTKCKIEVKSEGLVENEELKAVKLKNVKEFEMNIESGSTVKGLKANASSECKLTSGFEMSLKFKKNVAVKGASLMPPVVTKTIEGESVGRILLFPNTTAGGGNFSDRLVSWLSNFSNTNFGLAATQNFTENVFSLGADTCSLGSFPINTGCGTHFVFKPLKKEGYGGLGITKWTFTGRRGAGGEERDVLVGQGV